MSRKYPHLEFRNPEISSFWKKYNGFYQRHDVDHVFDTFLIIMINLFSDGNFIKERDQYVERYNRAQCDTFNEMVRDFMALNQSLIGNDTRSVEFGTVDILGQIYEAIVQSRWAKSAFGQYFTPEHVCLFMAKIIFGDPAHGGKKPPYVNDPCSGSGRMLLAAHSLYPSAYIIAADLDMKCAMMTLVNLYIHGARGEVVCKNSLDPTDFKKGWIIESIPGIGIPIIKELKKEDSFQYTMWEHNYRIKNEPVLTAEVKKDMTIKQKEIVNQHLQKNKQMQMF